MLSSLFIMMIIMLIPMFLLIINLLVSKKMFIDREKSTPFECGFDPYNISTSSFSIQFFLIGIMFLTFDIEIVILIPMVFSIKSKNLNWLISSMFIMLILIAGLYLEWMENSINWES